MFQTIHLVPLGIDDDANWKQRKDEKATLKLALRLEKVSIASLRASHVHEDTSCGPSVAGTRCYRNCNERRARDESERRWRPRNGEALCQVASREQLLHGMHYDCHHCRYVPFSRTFASASLAEIFVASPTEDVRTLLKMHRRFQPPCSTLPVSDLKF